MHARIAVGYERYFHWHQGFADVLSRVRERERWFDFEVVDFDRHDWMERIAAFDSVLWKSYVLGPEAAAHYKEKIYFLESHLHKLVFPSFKTLWHFESKAAQSYVFKHEGTPTPRTVVSFDFADAVAALEGFPPPYVFKRPAGAGSNDVWLVEDREQAKRELERTFAYQLWSENADYQTRLRRIVGSVRHVHRRWMRQRIKDWLSRKEPFRAAYWQEFIGGNQADLRITVIGKRYGCAFWRRNRPDDFRASGSGLLDYETPIPMAALKLCFDFVNRMDYDTMAFDLLQRDGQWLIGEMSYAYMAKAIADAPGIYERSEEDLITYVPGSRTAQELWVMGLLNRIRQAKRTSVELSAPDSM